MVWEERILLFQSKKLFYRIKGNGSVLVLLHGYLGSSEIFLSLAERFTSRYRVLCPDLPGHGQSECLSELHSMELMADAVHAILVTENIETANFCGHSMGGYVALAFLNKYPTYCQSLVLLNSHPFADTEEKKENRQREISLIRAQRKNLLINQYIQSCFEHRPFPVFKAERDLLRRIASQNSSDAMIAAIQGMSSRANFIAAFEKPKIPLLWVMGEKELNSFPFSEFKVEKPEILQKIAVIKAADHMSFLEEEKRVYVCLKNFFDEVNHLHRS